MTEIALNDPGLQALNVFIEEAKSREDRIKQAAEAPLRKFNDAARVLADRAEWDRILPEVRQVFPAAILAGGPVRDHFLNLPANDLDIFVPFKGTMEMAVAKLRTAGILKTLAGGPGHYRSGRYSGGGEERIDNFVIHGKIMTIALVDRPLHVDIVLMPVEPDMLETAIRQLWPIPLNWGSYNGSFSIPPAMQTDLTEMRISVLRDLLPEGSAALADIFNRAKKLHRRTGWPVVLV